MLKRERNKTLIESLLSLYAFLYCVFLFSYNIFFTEYNIIKRKHVRFTSLILDRSFVNIQKLESDR